MMSITSIQGTCRPNDILRFEFIMHIFLSLECLEIGISMNASLNSFARTTLFFFSQSVHAAH